MPAVVGGLIASATHGFYDFLVLLQPVSALPIAAAMIIGIWLWRLRLMHRLHKEAIEGSDAQD